MLDYLDYYTVFHSSPTSLFNNIQKSTVGGVAVIHIPGVYDLADSLPTRVFVVSWRLDRHAA